MHVIIILKIVPVFKPYCTANWLRVRHTWLLIINLYKVYFKQSTMTKNVLKFCGIVFGFKTAGSLRGLSKRFYVIQYKIFPRL